MTASMKPEITSSTGNVFRDIGFGPEEPSICWLEQTS